MGIYCINKSQCNWNNETNYKEFTFSKLTASISSPIILLSLIVILIYIFVFQLMSEKISDNATITISIMFAQLIGYIGSLDMNYKDSFSCNIYIYIYIIHVYMDYFIFFFDFLVLKTYIFDKSNSNVRSTVFYILSSI